MWGFLILKSLSSFVWQILDWNISINFCMLRWPFPCCTRHLDKWIRLHKRQLSWGQSTSRTRIQSIDIIEITINTPFWNNIQLSNFAIAHCKVYYNMILLFFFFFAIILNMIGQDVFGKKSYIATQGNIHYNKYKNNELHQLWWYELTSFTFLIRTKKKYRHWFLENGVARKRTNHCLSNKSQRIQNCTFSF